jgi:hypothetical protein
MTSSEVRNDLCFVFDLGGGKFGILELDPNDANRPPVVYPASSGIGWDPYAYVFEVDAAQVAALIAKLTKPKRKPKLKSAPQRPRGAPKNLLKQTILADARQRIDTTGKTAKLAADLHAHYKKRGGPSERTIRRWLADDDATRT